jgi:hypothetical protein
MTDEQLKKFVALYPLSDIAHAYRLGLKDQLLRMQPVLVPLSKQFSELRRHKR